MLKTVRGAANITTGGNLILKTVRGAANITTGGYIMLKLRGTANINY
jgi:hypothetical protein